MEPEFFEHGIANDAMAGTAREMSSRQFYAKVIEDSLAPCGKRLTTVEVKYWRGVHSELLTHRAFARNSASSRAIPWARMMKNICETPMVPIAFGAEQKGMQTGGEVEDLAAATAIWLEARRNAVESAKKLAALGVHKSICNRLTEPFMWITVVVSATEWENFYRLRCHPDAEIHFQKIAGLMRDAIGASTPVYRKTGEAHLPYILPEERDGRVAPEVLAKMSVARCARVSYRTFDGTVDIAKDLDLFDKLTQGSGFGHWSPMEHVAFALTRQEQSGPFVGWQQFRKKFANECAPEKLYDKSA